MAAVIYGEAVSRIPHRWNTVLPRLCCSICLFLRRDLHTTKITEEVEWVAHWINSRRVGVCRRSYTSPKGSSLVEEAFHVEIKVITSTTGKKEILKNRLLLYVSKKCLLAFCFWCHISVRTTF
jgi:hypothetical protein